MNKFGTSQVTVISSPSRLALAMAALTFVTVAILMLSVSAHSEPFAGEHSTVIHDSDEDSTTTTDDGRPRPRGSFSF